jgi:hypothetical protein
MVKKPPQLEGDNLWRGYDETDRYMTCANCICCIAIMIILICLGARINGHVFLSLNESWLTQFGISLGFKIAIMSVIQDLVCSWESLYFSITCTCYVQKSSQQPPSSEGLPLPHHQSQTSSMAVPRTTQYQLSSPTTRQQTKIGKL